MKHNAIQSSLSLRDIARTPRKRQKDTVKKIRVVKPDEQNSHLNNELLVWGMIHQPLWIATITAQPEQTS